MPAADYRIPGALAFDELSTTLRIALSSGKAVDVKLYDLQHGAR